ncbi:6752_t:CDS:2 [Funneliformis caledonium]|uniref:6752_t:CDS:1 n=1 Tax=Funneliformis caledonium TaxID=1117310 RepID=A0A9N8VTZ4_9GLOM|nr:6752_t:CDS:2 [Funneliformis caledonium]
MWFFKVQRNIQTLRLHNFIITNKLITNKLKSSLIKNGKYGSNSTIILRNLTTSNRRSNPYQKRIDRNKSFLMYTIAVLVFGVGFTYASVPLYRMFCQTTGFSGTPNTDISKFSPKRLIPAKESRRIKIHFNADTSLALDWSFVPQQREVYVLPGETALAFYTATNKSNQDIIGLATYNVTPYNAGQYFNKIQCFCFEEQKLQAGEAVDMPVFFFIDPEFAEDPLMKDIDTVTLSYTFFKAKYDDNGTLIPVPTT